MEPLGRVEGDPGGDVLSLHRQTEGRAARDLDHVAASAVGVGEDCTGVSATIHAHPQRDGERFEPRERFVEQQRVADWAQLRELEM